jgi:tetratricopeptide (TPR) repeat protein
MLRRLWLVVLILSVSSVIWTVPVMAQDDELCDVITVEFALPANPSTAETLVDTGFQMTVRNDFATAITLFSQALELDSDLSDIYLYRGCAYANNNDPDSAIADLQTYSTLINDRALSNNIEAYVENIMSGPRACMGGTTYADQNEARITVVGFIEQGADGDDFNDRGLAHICLGNYEQAIRDFSRALDLDKTVSQYYANRGFVYDLQSNYESAVLEYERAIQLDSQNDVAWNNLGYALSALERYDEALDAYNEALKLDASDAVTLSNRADLYIILERYEDAEVDYTEAIKVNPIAFNYNVRGLFYLDFNITDLAISDFELASELEPDSAVYLNNLGYSYYLQFDYENAITYLNESLALDSNYDIARSNRGLAYWQSGEYALCIADYTVLLSVDPNDDVSANNRGLCHEDLNQFDLAIADFTRALEIDGVNIVELHNRGRVLRKAERYEDALEDYSLSIEMDNTNSRSWNDRGVVYDYMGDLENALADYSQAIVLDPNDAIAYYNRAYIHIGLGNDSLAIDDLEAYISVAPDGYYREDADAMLAELGAGGS